MKAKKTKGVSPLTSPGVAKSATIRTCSACGVPIKTTILRQCSRCIRERRGI